MPYTAAINRLQPGCLLFLLNQSMAMTDFLSGQGCEKQHAVADACNRILQILTLACTREDGVGRYFDIGVLGYGSDKYFNPSIQSFHLDSYSFEPVVTSNDDPPVSQWQNLLIPITELSANQKLERRTQKHVDEDTGDLVDFEAQQPYWVQPVPRGGTTVCRALYECYYQVEDWIYRYPQSFPPIVIHITPHAEEGEGDPIPYAEALTSLTTEDGHVLLFSCHLSSFKAARPYLYPTSDELLPDEDARILYRMSSVIPDTIVDRVKKKGVTHVSAGGPRGMVYQADMAVLVEFLKVATSVLR